MLDFAAAIDSQIAELKVAEPILSGKLVRVVGLTLEAKGIIAPLGAHCRVENIDMGTVVDAEVVGFNDDTLYLMPFSEPGGIGPGARVWVVSRHAKASLGDAMLGRVIDGLGQPLDDGGPIAYSDQLGLEGLAINPMERGPINKILDTGIKAINTCLTLGQGQRIGLVAGSGVGKSVLLGMLTRNTEADVVVIGLIGERGREVQEFIQHTLGEEGLAKSVVVAAPANISPVLRLKATYLTHSDCRILSRSRQKCLMLCDSLTRVAHAQREIGLAIGEPPTAKGYPPSVFAMLPRLIERTGVGRKGMALLPQCIRCSPKGMTARPDCRYRQSLPRWSGAVISIPS